LTRLQFPVTLLGLWQLWDNDKSTPTGYKMKWLAFPRIILKSGSNLGGINNRLAVYAYYAVAGTNASLMRWAIGSHRNHNRFFRIEMDTDEWLLGYNRFAPRWCSTKQH
jgi:hypothetical protein